MGVAPTRATATDLATVAARLLGRARVPWERHKGGEIKTVDPRPPIVALAVETREIGGLDLRMRTRIHRSPARADPRRSSRHLPPSSAP